MSIDLATTQPVQQAGVPRAPGSPQADQLGLTLRERMWLARAALATMAVSAVGFGVLLTMLPGDAPAHAGVLETHLAATADVPLAPHPPPPVPPPASVVVAPPLPEPVVAPTPAPAVVALPEPKPVPASAPKSKPAGKVAVSRGKIAATMLPAERAVDLSKPQPLAAPKPVEREPEPVEEPPPPPPKVLAKPKPAADEEPALKRPSFE